MEVGENKFGKFAQEKGMESKIHLPNILVWELLHKLIKVAESWNWRDLKGQTNDY